MLHPSGIGTHALSESAASISGTVATMASTNAQTREVVHDAKVVLSRPRSVRSHFYAGRCYWMKSIAPQTTTKPPDRTYLTGPAPDRDRRLQIGYERRQSTAKADLMESVVTGASRRNPMLNRRMIGG